MQQRSCVEILFLTPLKARKLGITVQNPEKAYILNVAMALTILLFLARKHVKATLIVCMCFTSKY